MRRRSLLLDSKIDKAVDLGLPSGILWASGNLMADGNGGCKIADNPWDYGDYWSWGNVEISGDGYANSDGKAFTQAMYNNTSGSQISSNLNPTNPQQDVAFKYLGGSWRIPTKDDFIELINNTTQESTYLNGIGGYKFINKIDNNIYIFIPKSGICMDNSIRRNRQWQGYCFSSTQKDSTAPWSLRLNEDKGVSVVTVFLKYYGLNIRPVCN